MILRRRVANVGLLRPHESDSVERRGNLMM